MRTRYSIKYVGIVLAIVSIVAGAGLPFVAGASSVVAVQGGYSHALITATPTASATTTPTPTRTVSATASPGTTRWLYLPLLRRPSPYGGVPTPTATATRPPASPTPAAPTNQEQNEQTVAALINGQRGSHGIAALHMATTLTNAARRHSTDMATHNLTGHTGSDGSSPWDRIRDAGYPGAGWAEIIGWGFGGDPNRMMDWWMNSSIHRNIILSGNLDDFGVGYVYAPSSAWRHYWTVDFGRSGALQNADPAALHLCTFSAVGEEGGAVVILYTDLPCDALLPTAP